MPTPPLYNGGDSMIVFSIVGARPEFVQAAPVTVALRGRCREFLVHTGQHYDDEMSQTFFRDLDLPKPDLFLEAGSGLQGEQTARVLERVERAILDLKPDVMLLRSDTNSTLGAALAAAKLGLPIIKVEAGMRSFDHSMPEEINRIVADHVCDALLCSTPTAKANLEREGIRRPIEVVGDVLFDSVLTNIVRAEERSDVLARNGLKANEFVLATVHRAGNTDDPARLAAIIEGLRSSRLPVIFPAHPRTVKIMQEQGIEFSKPIIPIAPVSYLDMLMLTKNAQVIATDSGGVQREAYMLGRPCVTLRPNTEWVETVETGWNKLADADTGVIKDGIASFRPTGERPPIFGDGHAGQKVADWVMKWGAERGLVKEGATA
ncbi:MAG: UDP-N-acetylglucosamine 2-epimerase (non-hydrolyzing) [Candidatus Eremiobacteraeota bacterium]|nr:UDP-N-acetylglucosamine 2-epimerase (non-hydrolyzing) [Candidatus Eremiobacteraeota bacterium]